MPFVNLQVEVHCQQPNWVSRPHNLKYQNPIYRIYLNGDLFTERTWIWDSKRIFISEDIWAQLGKNISYTIKLVPVLKNSAQAKFKLTNLEVNDVEEVVFDSVNDCQLTFKIR